MNATRALLFAVVAALAGIGSPQSAQSADGKVEVTFDYRRQGGFATNQFAAWVQDAKGDMVKTLFVTDFTAGRDGWKTRKEAIPQWVETSGIASSPIEKSDAISGATPSSGGMAYKWDCRDASGKPVAPGDYTVVVEGTLRGNNRVVFSAPVRVGGAASDASPEPQYSGTDTAERNMIANVRVRYIP